MKLYLTVVPLVLLAAFVAGVALVRSDADAAQNEDAREPRARKAVRGEKISGKDKPGNDPLARYRPHEAADDGQVLEVSDLEVTHAVDRDGLRVDTAYQHKRGEWWTYKAVEVVNVNVTGGWRTSSGREKKLHTDLAQFRGMGPTPVWLAMRNITMTCGEVPEDCSPSEINMDGKFAGIWVERVEADASLKLKVETPVVVLVDSPGVKLLCWKGVEKVVVVNSPGAVVNTDRGSRFPNIIEGVEAMAELATLRGEMTAAMAE